MSLVGFAEKDRSDSVAAHKSLAATERNRQFQEEQLEDQQSAQQSAAAGSALGTGVATFAATGNPYAAIGVGVASLFLGGLF